MCVAAFPKATQLFRDERFHKVRNWMNMNRSIIFEIFGNLKLPGEVGSSDWKIISWKKKIWKMSTFPFMVFAFSFYICSLSAYEKEKDREEIHVACGMSLCMPLPAWLISTFYNGFYKWIVNVVRACNFGKESIRNLRCIKITFSDFILFN